MVIIVIIIIVIPFAIAFVVIWRCVVAQKRAEALSFANGLKMNPLVVDYSHLDLAQTEDIKAVGNQQRQDGADDVCAGLV